VFKNAQKSLKVMEKCKMKKFQLMMLEQGIQTALQFA